MPEAASAAEIPTEDILAVEIPADIPVEEPTPEALVEEAPVEETPAENLEAMLSAEVEAMAEAAPEEIVLEEPVPEEELVLEEPAPSDELVIEEPAPTDELVLEEPVPSELEMALEEPVLTEEMAQTPVEFDMSQAADAMAGAVADIEAFLDAEDYEYTEIRTDQKTLILIKAQDGSSMAINYDNDEFVSLESSYDKDGKTGYSEITNIFVKDVIKTGCNTGIKRHKGNNVVAG